MDAFGFAMLMLAWLIVFLATRKPKKSSSVKVKPSTVEDTYHLSIESAKHSEEMLRLMGDEQGAEKMRKRWQKEQKELDALSEEERKKTFV